MYFQLFLEYIILGGKIYILQRHPQSTDIFSPKPINSRRLVNLCGPANEHLRQIAEYFDVKIYHRSHEFLLVGYSKALREARSVLDKMYQATGDNHLLTAAKVYTLLKQSQFDEGKQLPMKEITVKTRHKDISASSKHQANYIENIRHHDINFAIGPAGTGKTYLAVACAVESLDKGLVKRFVFVRPAVEAGEKLGYLPGDLEEKILPYLRPLYDALYETLGIEQAKKLINNDIIEIAPLAFMRGRTLNDAFIILDEAQNTTIAQMKMFLTRIGFGSTAVITGDITQIDLPPTIPSGLFHAKQIFKGIDKIGFSYFDAKDVVRHPLVSTIIEAYDSASKLDDDKTK